MTRGLSIPLLIPFLITIKFFLDHVPHAPAFYGNNTIACKQTPATITKIHSRFCASLMTLQSVLWLRLNWMCRFTVNVVPSGAACNPIEIIYHGFLVLLANFLEFFQGNAVDLRPQHAGYLFISLFESLNSDRIFRLSLLQKISCVYSVHRGYTRFLHDRD